MVSLHAEVRDQCSVHLINEGVVVENGLVTVMVQATGPSFDNRLSNPQFECRVDRRGGFNPCKLMIILYTLQIHRLLIELCMFPGGGAPIQLGTLIPAAALPGAHRVDIRPLDPDDVCRRIILRRNIRYSIP